MKIRQTGTNTVCDVHL